MIKRLLAIVLAVVMVVSVFDMSVFAVDSEFGPVIPAEPEVSVPEIDFVEPEAQPDDLPLPLPESGELPAPDLLAGRYPLIPDGGSGSITDAPAIGIQAFAQINVDPWTWTTIEGIAEFGVGASTGSQTLSFQRTTENLQFDASNTNDFSVLPIFGIQIAGGGTIGGSTDIGEAGDKYNVGYTFGNITVKATGFNDAVVSGEKRDNVIWQSIGQDGYTVGASDMIDLYPFVMAANPTLTPETFCTQYLPNLTEVTIDSFSFDSCVMTARPATIFQYNTVWSPYQPLIGVDNTHITMEDFFGLLELPGAILHVSVQKLPGTNGTDTSTSIVVQHDGGVDPDYATLSLNWHPSREVDQVGNPGDDDYVPGCVSMYIPGAELIESLNNSAYKGKESEMALYVWSANPGFIFDKVNPSDDGGYWIDNTATPAPVTIWIEADETVAPDAQWNGQYPPYQIFMYNGVNFAGDDAPVFTNDNGIISMDQFLEALQLPGAVLTLRMPAPYYKGTFDGLWFWLQNTESWSPISYQLYNEHWYDEDTGEACALIDGNYLAAGIISALNNNEADLNNIRLSMTKANPEIFFEQIPNPDWPDGDGSWKGEFMNDPDQDPLTYTIELRANVPFDIEAPAAGPEVVYLNPYIHGWHSDEDSFWTSIGDNEYWTEVPTNDGTETYSWNIDIPDDVLAQMKTMYANSTDDWDIPNLGMGITLNATAYEPTQAEWAQLTAEAASTGQIARCLNKYSTGSVGLHLTLYADGYQNVDVWANSPTDIHEFYATPNGDHMGIDLSCDFSDWAIGQLRLTTQQFVNEYLPNLNRIEAEVTTLGFAAHEASSFLAPNIFLQDTNNWSYFNIGNTTDTVDLGETMTPNRYVYIYEPGLDMGDDLYDQRNFGIDIHAFGDISIPQGAYEYGYTGPAYRVTYRYSDITVGSSGDYPDVVVPGNTVTFTVRARQEDGWLSDSNSTIDLRNPIMEQLGLTSEQFITEYLPTLNEVSYEIEYISAVPLAEAEGITLYRLEDPNNQLRSDFQALNVPGIADPLNIPVEEISYNAIENVYADMALLEWRGAEGNRLYGHISVIPAIRRSSGGDDILLWNAQGDITFNSDGLTTDQIVFNDVPGLMSYYGVGDDETITFGYYLQTWTDPDGDEQSTTVNLAEPEVTAKYGEGTVFYWYGADAVSAHDPAATDCDQVWDIYPKFIDPDLANDEPDFDLDSVLDERNIAYTLMNALNAAKAAVDCDVWVEVQTNIPDNYWFNMGFQIWQDIGGRPEYAALDNEDFAPCNIRTQMGDDASYRIIQRLIDEDGNVTYRFPAIYLKMALDDYLARAQAVGHDLIEENLLGMFVQIWNIEFGADLPVNYSVKIFVDTEGFNGEFSGTIYPNVDEDSQESGYWYELATYDPDWTSGENERGEAFVEKLREDGNNCLRISTDLPYDEATSQGGFAFNVQMRAENWSGIQICMPTPQRDENGNTYFIIRHNQLVRALEEYDRLSEQGYGASFILNAWDLGFNHSFNYVATFEEQAESDYLELHLNQWGEDLSTDANWQSDEVSIISALGIQPGVTTAEEMFAQYEIFSPEVKIGIDKIEDVNGNDITSTAVNNLLGEIVVVTTNGEYHFGGYYDSGEECYRIYPSFEFRNQIDGDKSAVQNVFWYINVNPAALAKGPLKLYYSDISETVSTREYIPGEKVYTLMAHDWDDANRDFWSDNIFLGTNGIYNGLSLSEFLKLYKNVEVSFKIKGIYPASYDWDPNTQPLENNELWVDAVSWIYRDGEDTYKNSYIGRYKAGDTVTFNYSSGDGGTFEERFTNFLQNEYEGFFIGMDMHADITEAQANDWAEFVVVEDLTVTPVKAYTSSKTLSSSDKGFKWLGKDAGKPAAGANGVIMSRGNYDLDNAAQYQFSTPLTASNVVITFGETVNLGPGHYFYFEFVYRDPLYPMDENSYFSTVGFSDDHAGNTYTFGLTKDNPLVAIRVYGDCAETGAAFTLEFLDENNKVYEERENYLTYDYFKIPASDIVYTGTSNSGVDENGYINFDGSDNQYSLRDFAANWPNARLLAVEVEEVYDPRPMFDLTTYDNGNGTVTAEVNLMNAGVGIKNGVTFTLDIPDGLTFSGDFRRDVKRGDIASDMMMVANYKVDNSSSMSIGFMSDGGIINENGTVFTVTFNKTGEFDANQFNFDVINIILSDLTEHYTGDGSYLCSTYGNIYTDQNNLSKVEFHLDDGYYIWASYAGLNSLDKLIMDHNNYELDKFYQNVFFKGPNGGKMKIGNIYVIADVAVPEGYEETEKLDADKAVDANGKLTVTPEGNVKASDLLVVFDGPAPADGKITVTTESGETFDVQYHAGDLFAEVHGIDDSSNLKSVEVESSELPGLGDVRVIGDTSDYMLGDVNEDGRVTLNDAILALQLSLNTVTEGPGVNAQAADYDQSGKVTLSDAILILQKTLGTI